MDEGFEQGGRGGSVPFSFGLFFWRFCLCGSVCVDFFCLSVRSVCLRGRPFVSFCPFVRFFLNFCTFASREEELRAPYGRRRVDEEMWYIPVLSVRG